MKYINRFLKKMVSLETACKYMYNFKDETVMYGSQMCISLHFYLLHKAKL